ncbi:MAG TPA: BA14K family protein [Tianweitania sediminis]|jgi:hypothetical protein|nr:BA14K family protein [Tianweitania sediminis]
MKPLMMILGGFCLTAGTFTAGAVAATALLAAKPVETHSFDADATGLWTSQPVRVDREDPTLQRATATEQQLASLPPAKETSDASERNDHAIDDMVTSALPVAEEPAVNERLLAAHLDWCSSRYRSFNPSDNTYRPYSGGKQQCVSPHLSEAAPRLSASIEPALEEEAVFQQASFATSASGTATLSQAHIRDCSQRYRSYRIEDNTYQPYGGGPRRQCD